MQCVNCGSNAAQLYKKTVDGKEKTLCLCSACYEKMYAAEDVDLFTQFLGNTGGKQSKSCPSCGTTLGEFKRTGLLGCADCYRAFYKELISTIRYCQRDVVHRGKTPSGKAEGNYDYIRDLVREQDSVKAKIERALLKGDYALARELEVKLKAIKEKLQQTGDERWKY